MIISVLGLGYVGKPLALKLAKHHTVIAYDISTKKIEDLQRNYPDKNITFTSYPPDLHLATIHMICVPTLITTPVINACDEEGKPDISSLLDATGTVAHNLKFGDIVIFESSVYPGCTEEVCVPILERISNSHIGQFRVAYSPERINPGDQDHQLSNIKKVVAASDPQTLDVVANLYEQIIEAGVYRAPSIRVAEASKMLENTQRAVNIALMNEFSILCNKMGINTLDVIDAARTKWNFLPFSPGLVGGNCIGIAPHYLDVKAKELGFKTQIISNASSVNEEMASYVANQVINRINYVKNPRILILGATYKENVSDVRNSRSFDVYYQLTNRNIRIDVEIADPIADIDEVKDIYYVDLSEPSGQYDAIILAVPHRQYVENYEDIQKMMKDGGIFFDVKGALRGKLKDVIYQNL